MEGDRRGALDGPKVRILDLSPATRALLDELRALPGFEGERAETAADLLERIADRGEPHALREVLSLVLDDEPLVARSAARSAATLLAATPASQLAWLDEQLRQIGWWRRGWWEMRPEQLSRLDRFEHDGIALLQLATLHPSGYVREAAVGRLGARAAAASIPFLLLRRNDWVAQVRAAAREALDRCIAIENAPQIVEALPEILRLRALSRDDHRAFVARVEALLRQPDGSAALLAGTRSPSVPVRRDCFALALATPELAGEELTGAGLADADPMVRLRVACALANAAPASLASWLDRLERDVYPPVRQAGLDLRVSGFPAEAVAAYVRHRHLLDRNTAIRSQAQQGYQKAERSALDFYRGAVLAPQGGTLDVALLGVCETGRAEDAALAARFPRPRAAARPRRCAASGSRLGEQGLRELLTAMLSDPSPRVSREARNAFLVQRVPVTLDVLESIVAQGPGHASAHAIDVAPCLPRWPRLSFMLEVARREGDLARRGKLGVSRWMVASNRAVLSPSKPELQEASRRCMAARHRLPPPLFAQLDFMLRQLAR